IPGPQLIEVLSKESKTNASLSSELGNSPIAVKPSFYLMVATLGGTSADALKESKRYARVLFDSINARLRQASSLPTLKDFQLVSVESKTANVVELQVAWHQIMHYWSINAVFEHVYALELGFVFLDLARSKALICCHTVKERDLITEALEGHL